MIDSLARERRCEPDPGFDGKMIDGKYQLGRWTRAEKEFCASLNRDIDQARAKAAKSRPFGTGTL